MNALAIAVVFIGLFLNTKESVNVTSNGFIFTSVKYSSVRNTDYFSIVFRTKNHNGILLFCFGDENYLLLELYHAVARLSVKYIGQVRQEPYEGYVGSGLADNRAHQLEIYRETNSVMLVLDRGSSSAIVAWPVISRSKLVFKIDRIYVAGFYKLSVIDRAMSLSQTGLVGCIEEAVWNNVNLLYQSYANSSVSYCEIETFTPISFIEPASYITLNRNEQASGLTLVFDLMIYLNYSTLLFNADGNSVLNISIVNGSFFMALDFGDSDYINAFLPMIKINDGKWHRVVIQLPGKNTLEAPIVVFGVDDEIVASHSSFTYDTKRDIKFGGYNFVGCINNLMVDGSIFHLFPSTERNGVAENGCQFPDRCIPNPCQHSGFCALGAGEFSCECPTSYPGDVCEDARYFLTCSNMFNCDLKNAGKQFLDVDGVGPLDPVPVICNNMEASNQLSVVTQVDTLLSGGKVTLNIEPTSVSIPYALTAEELRLLTQNSYYCVQEATYECSSSRITDGNSSLVFWTGGDGLVHDYWNSVGEYGACQCFVEGRRCDTDNRCNCDANDRVSRTDSVTFTDKNELPIMGITAIDISSSTGKSATIRVGPLFCFGIGGRINAVTFQEIFSYLPIKSVNFANPGSIEFQFKTDRTQGNVIVFAQGRPNDEYYVIELTSPNLMTAYFSMRSKKYTLNVELKPPHPPLDNLEYHQVFFKITAKLAYLIVDGAMNSIEIDYDFNSPVQVNKDNTPFFLGGSPYNMFSGYRGIVRMLRVNGVIIELRKLAKQLDLTAAGVHPGVLSACESTRNPCNFGECIDHFNYYLCDCNISPYYGKNCENEVGVIFDSPSSSLGYYFSVDRSLVGFVVSISFRTEKQGLLYLLQGEDQDVFILMDVYPLHIRLAMNLWPRRTKVPDIYKFYPVRPQVTFTDGKPNVVQLIFESDQFIMAINGRQNVVSKPINDLRNLEMKNPRWVCLGNAPEIRNFPDIRAEQFIGCLGGMKIKLEYDNKDDIEVIDVIKSAGGSNTKNIGNDVNSGICVGNLTIAPPAKLIPTPSNMVPGGQGFPISGITPSDNGQPSVGSSWYPVITAILILLASMLLLGSALFLRWYSRNHGIYITQEGTKINRNTEYVKSKTNEKANIALPQIASEEVEGWYL